MKRQISYGATGNEKRLVFAVWILGLFLCGLNLYFLPASWTRYDTMTDRVANVALLIGTTVVIFLVGWIVLKCKQVWIDENCLYAKGLSTEISVHFSDIEAIMPRWLPEVRMVRIHFKRETPFGKSIRFMPKNDWSREPLTSHPIVSELNSLIRAHSTQE